MPNFIRQLDLKTTITHTRDSSDSQIDIGPIKMTAPLPYSPSGIPQGYQTVVTNTQDHVPSEFSSYCTTERSCTLYKCCYLN